MRSATLSRSSWVNRSAALAGPNWNALEKVGTESVQGFGATQQAGKICFPTLQR